VSGSDAALFVCVAIDGVICYNSLTFNNKDIKVWNSMISACKDNGFALVVVAPIRRSAPSLSCYRKIG
jgi:hypothetical protein